MYGYTFKYFYMSLGVSDVFIKVCDKEKESVKIVWRYMYTVKSHTEKRKFKKIKLKQTHWSVEHGIESLNFDCHIEPEIE